MSAGSGDIFSSIDEDPDAPAELLELIRKDSRVREYIQKKSRKRQPDVDKRSDARRHVEAQLDAQQPVEAGQDLARQLSLALAELERLKKEAADRDRREAERQAREQQQLAEEQAQMLTRLAKENQELRARLALQDAGQAGADRRPPTSSDLGEQQTEREKELEAKNRRLLAELDKLENSTTNTDAVSRAAPLPATSHAVPSDASVSDSVNPTLDTPGSLNHPHSNSGDGANLRPDLPPALGTPPPGDSGAAPAIPSSNADAAPVPPPLAVRPRIGDSSQVALDTSDSPSSNDPGDATEALQDPAPLPAYSDNPGPVSSTAGSESAETGSGSSNASDPPSTASSPPSDCQPQPVPSESGHPVASPRPASPSPNRGFRPINPPHKSHGHATSERSGSPDATSSEPQAASGMPDAGAADPASSATDDLTTQTTASNSLGDPPESDTRMQLDAGPLDSSNAGPTAPPGSSGDDFDMPDAPQTLSSNDSWNSREAVIGRQSAPIPALKMPKDIRGPHSAKFQHLIRWVKKHFPSDIFAEFEPGKFMPPGIFHRICGIDIEHPTVEYPSGTVTSEEEFLWDIIIILCHVNEAGHLSDDGENRFVVAVVDTSEDIVLSLPGDFCGVFTCWGMQDELAKDIKGRYEKELGFSLQGTAKELGDSSNNSSLLQCLTAVRAYLALPAPDAHCQYCDRFFYLKMACKKLVGDHNKALQAQSSGGPVGAHSDPKDDQPGGGRLDGDMVAGNNQLDNDRPGVDSPSRDADESEDASESDDAVQRQLLEEASKTASQGGMSDQHGDDGAPVRPLQPDASTDTPAAPSRTPLPPGRQPTLPSMHVSDMGERFASSVMENLGPDFSGLINIEGLDDNLNLAEMSRPPPEGWDLLGIEYRQEGGACRVELTPKDDCQFQIPDFPNTVPRLSPEEVESYFDNICANPPQGTIAYYVGPSLTDHNRPKPQIDELLHPGKLKKLEEERRQRRAKGRRKADRRANDREDEDSEENAQVLGITDTYLMTGEEKASTAMHWEDFAGHCRSANLIRHGLKLWHLVDRRDNEKFENYLKNRYGWYLCDQAGRHLNILPSPRELKLAGIRFECFAAGPGQMVLTAPKQYHQVVNATASAAVAINFLLPDESLYPEEKVKTCQRCGLRSEANQDSDHFTCVEYEFIPPRQPVTEALPDERSQRSATLRSAQQKMARVAKDTDREQHTGEHTDEAQETETAELRKSSRKRAAGDPADSTIPSPQSPLGPPSKVQRKTLTPDVLAAHLNNAGALARFRSLVRALRNTKSMPIFASRERDPMEKAVLYGNQAINCGDKSNLYKLFEHLEWRMTDTSIEETKGANLRADPRTLRRVYDKLQRKFDYETFKNRLTHARNLKELGGFIVFFPYESLSSTDALPRVSPSDYETLTRQQVNAIRGILSDNASLQLDKLGKEFCELIMAGKQYPKKPWESMSEVELRKLPLERQVDVLCG